MLGQGLRSSEHKAEIRSAFHLFYLSFPRTALSNSCVGPKLISLKTQGHHPNQGGDF